MEPDIWKEKSDGDKEVFITQEYNENFKVKIIQDQFDKLKINIKQDAGEKLSHYVIIDPESLITAKIKDPIKVEVLKIPNDSYIFNESKELKFSGKSLLTLGILGLLYGKYNIKISSLLGITIMDKTNNLPGIINMLIIIELIIFFFYGIRDLRKSRTLSIDEEINLEKTLKQLKDRLKDVNNEQEKKNVEKKINEMENEIEKIKVERFNKYFIFLGVKISLPITIGIFGIYNLGINTFISMIKNFYGKDLVVLLCIFFLTIIISKNFLNKFIKN